MQRDDVIIRDAIVAHSKRRTRLTTTTPSLVWYKTRSVDTASSGVAKLGHTGARALATGGCAPPVQALLPNVPLSIANWALKVRKGVEIELRSLAICIFRITRSVCSLDLDVDYMCLP